MSASFSRPNFDDYSQGRQDDRRYQKVTPPSRPSTANKHSPGSASTLHLDKSQAKDIRGGVSTPDSSGLQSQAVARRYNESTNGEHSSNTHDSSEAQLVPGPPGIARRAKAHVPSACVNCKKKHLACETKRPCNRCTQTGKEASCVDVQHKKRGRPRLREDESFRDGAIGAGYVQGDTYQDRGSALSSSHSGRHRSKTYRELRSQPEAPYADQRPRTSDPTFSRQEFMQTPTGFALSPPAASFLADHIPTVLLTSEFVVAQHNHAFGDALGLSYTARGQALLDLVVPAERERVQRLQSVMRSELRDAAHSALMRGNSSSHSILPTIERLDIAHATAGFRTRSEYWTFRLPREQSRGFPISISLAKEGAHFVVLTLVQSTSALHAVQSPPMGQILHGTPVLSSNSLQNMPTPPHSSHSNHQPISHHHQHHRTGSADAAVPYLDQQHLPLKPHSLVQYRQSSPPRSVQASYHTPRTSSSGSASGSNSDIPRNSSGHHRPAAGESLRHLQLPPIRTTPTSDPASNKNSGQRKKSNTPSPARGSPHGSKRKKRRRVDIGEILH